ncbi:Thiolase-like protein type 1 additional C-terminal domain-containing protein [Sphingomonas antarctica]|uniref:acetyl-CoA acetyltransferase n=1 Tax=Sphingomonas antarctica TaxID=2040274 RepID=UPI0039E77B93
MSLDPERIPVLAGVGQINDREDRLDPGEMMIEALRRAEYDAGARVLADADSLSVVTQIAWPDLGDLSPRIADAVGMTGSARQSKLPHGDTPIRYLNDAADAIQRGESRIALVTGGEALRTARKRVNVDPVRARRREGHPTYAQQYGLVAPVDVYPLYENACRAAWGQTLAEAQGESGAIWAGMSEVAAANEAAWLRTAVSAAEVIMPSLANRPIAFPYTKLQVANSSVNQGAGFIVTSLAEARRRGVAEQLLVFVGDGAAAKEPSDILARDRYDFSVSMASSIGATLAANTLDAFDHVELYSCFPCVPKMARRIVHWPLEKPASVVGGLTFGGGPIGNYMSHAVAAMTLKLRGGGTGFLFANGGFATENHCIALAGRPFERRRGGYDVQAEADGARGAIPLLDEDYRGPASIETCTVFYDRDGEPRGGVVVARTGAGARTLARIDRADGDLIAWLTSGTGEPVGQFGTITGEDRHWRMT